LALQEGFALLTGETGLGKTLLAHRLVEQLDAAGTTLLLTNPHFTAPAALFQSMLFDLGSPFEFRSEHELRLHVTDRLLKDYQEHRPTLLIIDEAQHLTPLLLEELRLLGNLETRAGKVLQVLLIGLPAALETLKHADLFALQQRVRVRVTLSPLDTHESADYLAHQVRAAGGKVERLLGDETLELLARSCRGVPRLLNQAADLALQLAATAEQTSVDVEAALEALTELGLAPEESEEEPVISEPTVEMRILRPVEVEDQANAQRPRRLFMSGKRSA
jgi:type II secretory pathway predicted ATPase ExeA